MIGGWALVCLVVLALARTINAGPSGVDAAPGNGSTVAAFVRTALAPRVLVVEGALATTNQQVVTYCQAPELVLVRCTDLTVRQGIGNSGALAAALTSQAHVLGEASQGFDTLLPPDLGRVPALQLRCVVEDLALFSDQLSGLLQESAAALSSTMLQQATYAQPAPRVSYGPRVRAAVTILRRAEAWLETVDHEMGAHVTLPGFAPGAPSLESQLAMQ
jgi:hypothetical protein